MNSYLSRYFSGVMVKRLSVVETAPDHSNQHEFNATSEMKKLLGSERATLDAAFVYLADNSFKLTDTGFVTWYDARENNPTRSEYRLFYKKTDISVKAVAGDTLYLCIKPDRSLLVIVAAGGSMIDYCLGWFFDVSVTDRFSSSRMSDYDPSLRFVYDRILRLIDIEPLDDISPLVSDFINQYGEEIPDPVTFASFVRSSLPTLSTADPDHILMSWISQDYYLYCGLEKELLRRRMAAGFKNVRGFVEYSNKMQALRKGRLSEMVATYFSCLLQSKGLKFEKMNSESGQSFTMLFPGSWEFVSPSFPVGRRSLLTFFNDTVADEQLPEHDEINRQHILTLTPFRHSCSDEMLQNGSVQLVVPRAVQNSCPPDKRFWFLTVEEFLKILSEKKSGHYGC